MAQVFDRIKSGIRKTRRFIANLAFYESTMPSTLIRSSTPSSRPVDKELTPSTRQQAVSDVREIQTNSAFATGMVDTHIQYMGTYKFKCKSPYPEFNRQFELLFADWKRRKNCEVSETFCFDELLQIIERHRITDGDVMITKVKGGKIQLVEGDRVRTADGERDPEDQWTHGVKTNQNGKTVQYHISRRLPEGGFEDERHISADQAWLIGYRRNYGQKRGVSPMIVALRELKMLNKSLSYAMAREMLSQMIIFISKRDVSDKRIFPEPEKAFKDLENAMEQCLGQGFREALPDGLKHLGLTIGDSLELLQSQNPSQNTREFWEMSIRLVLYALRIPYSFYDETQSTFYGTRGAFERYMDACISSQLPMIDWLIELTEWLLAVWVEQGLIEIPFGETIESMTRYYMWNGGGMPYFIKFELAKEANLAYMMGLANPEDFAAQCGEDFHENVRKTGECGRASQEAGVAPPYAASEYYVGKDLAPEKYETFQTDTAGVVNASGKKPA